MPSLLSLPREVRDIIIELVISSLRESPPDIAAAEATRSTLQNHGPEKLCQRPPLEEARVISSAKTKRRRWYRRLLHLRATDPVAAEAAIDPTSSVREPIIWNNWAYTSWVRFERPIYISNSAPLLLVNHQLASETASALARPSAPYELDVIFVKERELWPTWLSVPLVSERLDQVNVTFRIFGNEGPTKRSAWRHGCGGPPPVEWCFYYLLEHVLRCGSLPRTSASVDEEISIKTLNLNFVGKNDVEEYLDFVNPETLAWNTDSREWKYTSSPDRPESSYYGFNRERLLRPEWLADYLHGRMHSLLSMSYNYAQYGAILYERIGQTRFSVNGELKEEINFGAQLEQLDFHDPSQTFGHLQRDTRISAFREWKAKTQRVRQALSLNCS